MQIYVVGGAVRNVLMGLPVNDMDYAVVGSTAEEMLSLGYQVVGADFPVFLHPKTGDEYALARTERKRGKGYHGFEVNADPTITLEQDLMRRDLTINAMAVAQEKWSQFVTAVADGGDLDDILIDPYFGYADLRNDLIRPVALETFIEDPLRVVRAARFAGTYSMSWTTDMHQAAEAVIKSGELSTIPKERYALEMEKALSNSEFDGNVSHFRMLMADVGIMDGGAPPIYKVRQTNTSLASKLNALFGGGRGESYEPIDPAVFGMPTLVSDQMALNVSVHVAVHQLESLLSGDASVDMEDCATLFTDLALKITRAPAGCGLSYVLQFAAELGLDHDVYADVIVHAINLQDTIRYATHVSKDVVGSGITNELRRIRIQELALFIETKTAA